MLDEFEAGQLAVEDLKAALSWVRGQDGCTGKAGSLDNPEVVQDVPGYVIPILEQEFDDFVTESKRL